MSVPTLRVVAKATFALSLAASISGTQSNAQEADAVLSTVEVTSRHSKDEAATEHSDSYTAGQAGVGSKSNATIREIPQTISVLTRKRLDDQNLTTLEDAMKNTTGMTVLQTDPGRSDIFSRGFRVDTIQVDGVTANLNNFFITPDLYVYDRVEVLRGPNALFTGSGLASGSINLARKRALDFWQLQGSATGGSFNTKRGEVDVTGPLIASKKIRGRLIGAYEDRDSFLNYGYLTKPTVYGTLEFDMTDRTTVSIGATHTQIDYLPFAGLPAYANGTLLNVPRSTMIGADWNRWQGTTLDKFGEIEHKFDNGAKAKVSVRQIDRESDAIYMTPNTAVTAAGLTTLNRIRLGLNHNNTTYDAFFTTPFELFGQTHNITVGADYREFQYQLRQGTGPTATQNVFNPNNTGIPYQSINFATFSNTNETQSGMYGRAQIKPTAWLTLIGGARVSDWESYSINPVTGVRSGVGDINDNIALSYGAVIDITKQLSLYGSYNDIFQPQTSPMASGGLVPPRVGSQHEAGIKASLFDDRLNAHFAVFRIQDTNRALADPSNSGFSLPSGEVESKGFETEVTGRVMRGWDLTAGYAYTQTKYLQDVVANDGQSFAPTTPNHSYNLWTKYTFEDGWLKGFSVGGGAKIVSTFYTRSGSTRWVQEGYEVFTAQVGYKFNENLWATLTVNNVFDQTYYQWVNTSLNGNRYGEPRSALLKVSAKW